MLVLIKNNKVITTVAPTQAEKAACITHLETQGFLVLANVTASPGDIYDPVAKTFTTPIPEGNWKVSKRAFKNRFPRAKWNYASINRSISPLLFDMLESWDSASFIDLKDQETELCVNALTYDNIPLEARLTAAEADAILIPPASPGEE